MGIFTCAFNFQTFGDFQNNFLLFGANLFPSFFQSVSSSNFLETDVWQTCFLFKSNFLYPDAWKFGWVRITCRNLLPLRPLCFLLASTDGSWEDGCISISYFFADKLPSKSYRISFLSPDYPVMHLDVSISSFFSLAIALESQSWESVPCSGNSPAPLFP